jgi:hypothetical protein
MPSAFAPFAASAAEALMSIITNPFTPRALIVYR